MDPATLAATLGGLLAPAMPQLVNGAGTLVGGAVANLSPEAWELARRVWDRLGPKLLASPGAKDTVTHAAAKPEDPRVRGALELYLEDLLAQDASLAAEMGQLVEASSRRANVTVSVSGARGVGIGGSVSGGTIITGDRSSVSPG